MCIIITLPQLVKIKKEITEEILKFSWESNQDGAGYSYIEKIEKQEPSLCIKKGFFKFKGFYKSFLEDRKNNTESKFLIHFRFSTFGENKTENCHPFWIDNKDAAMAHNGTIYSLNAEKNKGPSDSNLFAEFLRKLPTKWYYNDSYCRLITEYIKTINKIVILTKNNSFLIWNEKQGFQEEDIWYSSDYYKNKRYAETNNKNSENLCCMCKKEKSKAFIQIDKETNLRGFCNNCYSKINSEEYKGKCLICKKELSINDKSLCINHKETIENVYEKYGEI
jgi:predicted glutamine amidotransferase